MEFREATESDLAFVGRHTISRGFFAKQPPRVEWVYALEHEGQILGVGGLKLMNPSTAWAWFDLTEFARGHMLIVYRVIRDVLTSTMAEHGLRRVMAVVEPDFPKAIRTIEHLGFEREAILKNFYDEKDGYLYARIQ